MEYSNIQSDFVERTLQNLNYVDKENIEDKKDFNEVTNLINNMLGLICYPHEISEEKLKQLKKGIDTEIQFKSPYGDIYLCLDKDGNVSNSLEEIKRHLRNAVCHGRFVQGKANNQKEIEEMRFQDFNNDVKNFDMIMSVNQMRIFVKEISKLYLSTF